jgi:hypothetical protein
VLFPLGLTKYQTPAASPLPGHLLATTGSAGHMAAVALLALAGVGFAVSLIVRPPADARAAAFRIALGLAVMFTLAPATRWGYFVYPIGLIGWVALTGRGSSTRVGTDAGTSAGPLAVAVAGAAAPLPVSGSGWAGSAPTPELAAARSKKLLSVHDVLEDSPLGRA